VPNQAFAAPRRNVRLLGTIITAYRPERWYWVRPLAQSAAAVCALSHGGRAHTHSQEVVLLVWRLLSGIVQRVFVQQPELQTLLTLLLLVAVVGANASLRPFRSALTVREDLATGSAAIVVAACGAAERIAR
jgi:hypothetical protein